MGVSGQLNAQCTDRPIINDFSPQTGFIGSTVTITGANFSAIPSENQVFFGATQATIVSSSFGTLEVRVPEGSTTALLSVKNKCNLSAYSKTHFNGVFCPTPLTATSYQNTAQELAGVSGAYNMLSQDMDNDGKPEVISALRGITIAQNYSTPGNINFVARNFGGSFSSLTTADFDGDGLKDIASNGGVFQNTSTGPGNIGLVFATDSKLVSSYQIGSGDFNNDGKIDIIGENGGSVWVAFNTSTGPGNFSFSTRQLVASGVGRCTGIQIADVDGDGRADFLGSQGQSNRAISIRNTTATGSTTSSFEGPEYWASDSNAADGTGTFPYRSMIADFDKDGRIDFTSCNYLGNTNVAIWRNTSTPGDIVFAPAVNIPSPTRNYRIGVGDVDGDGYPDIVTKSLGVNVFSVYRNTTSAAGAPSFAPRFDYTSSNRAEVSGIAIGDLDGDFVPDIATSGISSNTIRFHRNTGAQNDVTPPTVSCKNIVVALSPAGTVTITPEMIDNGSGDACGIESLVVSQTTFTCTNIGENTVTLTATDGAGNSSTCTATVNVQPAAIIVAGQSTVCQGETVNMNANDGDSYQWKKDGTSITGATTQNYVATTSGAYTVEVTNAGGCSGESLATDVVVNDNPTVDISPAGNAFLCPPNGSSTLTATQSSIYQWMKDGVDIANATQQTYEATTVGSYSVRVIDLFGCSAISEATVVSQFAAEIDVTNNGSNVTNGPTVVSDGFNLDYGNVLPNNSYDTLITIDNPSNIADNAILDVDVVISGPDAQYLSIADLTLPVGISPGTQANFALVFNGPDIRAYNATVTILSNDCDESSITINVTAEITCEAAAFSAVPSTISVNNDAGICGATVNYTAEATGNPTSTLTYTFSGATSGNGNGTGTSSLFGIGTTTVTLNATNPCGNVTESFDVTVTDNEAPVIEGQNSNLDMNFNAGNGSPASYSENGITFLSLYGSSSHVHLGDNDGDGSNDILNHANCCSTPYRLTVGSGTEFTLKSMNVKQVSGNPTFSVFPSGASVTISSTGTFTFPAGFENVTEVRWNQYSGTMIIDDMVVSTKTSGQCPTDITVSSDPGACGTNVSYSANATDNCDASVSFSPSSGSFFNVGVTAVTATATDSSGNTSNCTFDVIVEDNTLPTVTSQGTTIQLDASGNATITTNDIDNGSNDACGIKSLALDTTSFSCANVGLNTVTLTVTDNNDNVSIQTATVTVEDNVDPIAITQSATVQLDAAGNGTITATDIDNGSNDACGIKSLELDTTSFSCENVGLNTVTLTVTDNNDNVSIQTATVTVEDNVDPIAITQSATVQLDAFGNGTITATDIDNGSNDACGIKSLELDTTSFSCENVGLNTVTLTVTDNNNNVSIQTATVTVEDNVDPIAITQSATVQLDAFGNGTITATDIDNGSNDACGIKSLELDTTSFSCENVGLNTVTLTVTDNNDNVSIQTATVTVEDNVDPIAITQSATVQLDAFGNGTITATDIDNGSNDTCGIKSLALDTTSFSCENVGLNTVTLTVTDNNDNVSTQTATVTVEDTTAPTVITKTYSIDLTNGVADITPNNIDGGTFDNCDFTLSIDKDHFTCNDIGDHVVTLTATDASNNTTSSTAIVSVLGDVPTISINDFNAVNTQKKNTVFLGFGPQSINLTTAVTGGSGFTYEWTTSSGELVSNEANPSISPEVSTTYNVTVTNSNGCTASTSMYVCVIDARAFDKKGKYKGKVTVCHHTNGKKGTKHVQINISSDAVMTHLTKHGVGTDHADTLGACNAVCVDNTNARATSKTSFTTTSIEDNLLIYPNPSNGIFDIKLTSVNLQTELFLFDTTGKLIERTSITKENSAENIITMGNHNLASGFYLLKIITENESVTKKLIIEKSK
ncbi:hypothetical protein BTO04_01005 [Polaribacter sp. SA4-10]|nr:hypothetical protein BTO04_01005 [Polaribacter sp. SA4-10]